jgi:hypothetical protein
MPLQAGSIDSLSNAVNPLAVDAGLKTGKLRI